MNLGWNVSLLLLKVMMLRTSGTAMKWDASGRHFKKKA